MSICMFVFFYDLLVTLCVSQTDAMQYAAEYARVDIFDYLDSQGIGISSLKYAPPSTFSPFNTFVLIRPKPRHQLISRILRTLHRRRGPTRTRNVLRPRPFQSLRLVVFPLRNNNEHAPLGLLQRTAPLPPWPANAAPPERRPLTARRGTKRFALGLGVGVYAHRPALPARRGVY